MGLTVVERYYQGQRRQTDVQEVEGKPDVAEYGVLPNIIHQIFILIQALEAPKYTFS